MSYFNLIALFSDTTTKIGKFWCSGIYKALYIIFCLFLYRGLCPAAENDLMRAP